MTGTPARRAIGVTARDILGQQRAEDQAVALGQRALRGGRGTAIGVIGGDAHLLVLGIEQGELRRIGEALADAGIGAGQRHQQRDAVARDVDRNAGLDLLRLCPGRRAAAAAAPTRGPRGTTALAAAQDQRSRDEGCTKERCSPLRYR